MAALRCRIIMPSCAVTRDARDIAGNSNRMEAIQHRRFILVNDQLRRYHWYALICQLCSMYEAVILSHATCASAAAAVTAVLCDLASRCFG